MYLRRCATKRLYLVPTRVGVYRDVYLRAYRRKAKSMSSAWLPTCFWAKKNDRSKEQYVFHPLVCHMIDTYAVCEQILSQRVDGLFPSVSDPERSIPFIVGLHDLGKLSPPFQAGSEYVKQLLLSEGLVATAHRAPAKHGELTAMFVTELLIQAGWKEHLASRMGYCLGGHHGLFPSPNKLNRLRGASRQTGGPEWDRARNQILTAYLSALEFDGIPIIEAQFDNAFFVTLSGLVSVADWIASSEEWFQYAPNVSSLNDLLTYVDTARQQAAKAMDTLSWNYLLQTPQPQSFRSLFEFEHLRPLQASTEKIARILDGPSIVIIEAPMGEGKTEAALYLQDWLQAIAGHRGLYVALPTQATSNQMFGRVKEFLDDRYGCKKHCSSGPKAQVNLNLVHGHALLSEDLSSLQIGSICSEDEEQDAVVIAESWFNPKKRALLSPFAVGTVDQALLSVMQVRHSSVRLFGLANKTTILDEVHAYDVYTSTLIDRMIQWLSSIGSSILILSATLPEKRRNQLLEAYDPNLEITGSVPYPRITWATRGSGQANAAQFESRPQQDLEVEWVGGDLADIANRIVNEVEEGGCVSWICNTVGKAQDAYGVLREICRVGDSDIELMLFHARYPYEERKKREDEVLRRFGKHSEREGHKAILVATQVIEQSLDLDFDLMVTELAPIDLMLQRAGRIHRHKRNDRSHRMRSPRLYIVEPDTNDDGLPNFGVSAYLYDEYILFRSWLASRDLRHIKMPNGIEDLVETVYGEDQDIGMHETHVNKLRHAFSQRQLKLSTSAAGRVMKAPWVEDDIMKDYTKDLDEDDDPSTHQSLQAATRYTDLPSITVICLHRRSEGLSLSSEAYEPVNLDTKPDIGHIKRLIQRSVALSHGAVVGWFANQPTPKGWKRASILRHMKPAVFCDGVMTVQSWELKLDKDLGITIHKL